MNKDQYQFYRQLKNAGVELSKHNQIKPNDGSETFAHLVAKAAVMQLGLANGYRVASEVEVSHGQVDCLLWGNPERLTLAVEVETSPTEETKQDKLSRYVHQQPAIDDMILVNVTQMPMHMLEALDYVSKKIGLEP